jgi:hypothetical protein
MNDDAGRNGRACSGVGVAALPLRIAARDGRKDAGFAKSGFVRAGEESRMSTPRAAVKLASLAAGIGLAALLSGPGLAADDAVQPDIVLPEPPAATLVIETASPEPAAARASIRRGCRG